MRFALLMLLVLGSSMAAELPPGPYSCLYAQVDGKAQEAAMILTRADDGTLTIRADGVPMSFTGRIVGDKLYLLHQRIDAEGLQVTQVIATVGPDGYAAGSAWRSLNAEVMQKSNFVLKKTP